MPISYGPSPSCGNAGGFLFRLTKKPKAPPSPTKARGAVSQPLLPDMSLGCSASRRCYDRLFERPIQALVYASDSIADTHDRFHNLRGLFLHYNLSHIGLGQVKILFRRFLPRQAGVSFGCSGQGLQFGLIDLAFNSPPDAGHETQ